MMSATRSSPNVSKIESLLTEIRDLLQRIERKNKP